MPVLYLISTGDYSTEAVIAQHMFVILADRPDHPEIRKAVTMIANIHHRDEAEIVVQPLGKPV